MHAKYERRKTADANPFIDPQSYRAYVAEKDQVFQTKLAEQRAK